MQVNEPLVYHHVQFSLKLRRGCVVPIQYGLELRDGYLQLTPKMFNLTEEKDLCLEHRADPVACFAQLATENIRSQYSSPEDYQVEMTAAALSLLFACSLVYLAYVVLRREICERTNKRFVHTTSSNN